MLAPVLVDDIKKQITGAMKSGDAIARDVLRLALSEIQTAEARKNAPASDDDASNAIRKLIKSNEETLALTTDATRAETLRREVEVLSALLPKQLSVDEIVAALGSVHDAIKAAKGDGQATGVAMKHLKATGAAVSGNDVGAAVKKIRG
ncbi:MAG: GatB/YqeY domain-containing protein [Labilithrix sp.]|nr:GatB/YqeY domain-containing protein [Labilithrix sp.]